MICESLVEVIYVNTTIIYEKQFKSRKQEGQNIYIPTAKVYYYYYLFLFIYFFACDG